MDIYSLGIIFFEMCHTPLVTEMERVKILTDIREEDIIFPDSFDQTKLDKQVCPVEHVPHWHSHDVYML